jgi:hypothetical protein
MKTLRQLLLVSFLAVYGTNMHAAEEKSQPSSSPDSYGSVHTYPSPVQDQTDAAQVHPFNAAATTKLQAAFRGKQSRKKTSSLMQQAQAENESLQATDDSEDTKTVETQDQNKTAQADALFLQLTKNTTTQDTEKLHTLKNIIPQTSLSPHNKQHCLQKIEELLTNQTPEPTQRAFSDESFNVSNSHSENENASDVIELAEPAQQVTNPSIIYPADIKNNDEAKETKTIATKIASHIKSKAPESKLDKDLFTLITDEEDAAITARWNERTEKLNLWVGQQQKNIMTYMSALQHKIKTEISTLEKEVQRQRSNLEKEIQEKIKALKNKFFK